PGHDYGADLILERFGERTVVQAKRRKQSIGVKAVQEVATAKKYYSAHKALVVISSTFTKNAKELAKSNNVELWNRTQLVQEIKKMHFV
ncbi:MAG: restriction endonuclease, partial [Candidatus Heimdallarchaeota archaeon]